MPSPTPRTSPPWSRCSNRDKKGLSMDISIVPGYDTPQTFIPLFREYTDILVAESPGFAKYLQMQGYDSELLHPEVKYAMPHGRLYLARYNGEVAGCVALKRLDGRSCEMKRLYVRPKFQGLHIGRRLAEQVIADAREIGYDAMLLDTLPTLRPAIGLYKTLGFYEVPRYNENPVDGCVYMRLDLKG